MPEFSVRVIDDKPGSKPAGAEYAGRQIGIVATSRLVSGNRWRIYHLGFDRSGRRLPGYEINDMIEQIEALQIMRD